MPPPSSCGNLRSRNLDLALVNFIGAALWRRAQDSGDQLYQSAALTEARNSMSAPVEHWQVRVVRL